MKKFFAILALFLALTACSAHEPAPTSLQTLTQTQLDTMPYEESENLFEGHAPSIAGFQFRPASAGVVQPAQPCLR
jgi:hypothetical protein